MTYEIQVLKMGQCEVPGPEVYWMSAWDTWETLYFWTKHRGSTFRIAGAPARQTPKPGSWLSYARQPSSPVASLHYS